MKKILLSAIIIISVVLGGWYAYNISRDTPNLEMYSVTDSGDLNASQVRAAIEKNMKMHGGKATYELFKTVYTINPGKAHTAAHIFGEVLYRIEGMGGIAVCDSDFGFGCYHSFFGRAIADRGVDSVKTLDDICVETYGVQGLGCPHGIGHGLGEYFGPTKLLDQLEICNKLTWKGRYMGCQGGVFMEYNTPTQVSEVSVSTGPRPFDERYPYGSCLDVSRRHQPVCYLELGGWWEQVLARDYVRMGALCGNIKDVALRESCFLGIGYSMAPSNGYNTEVVLSNCSHMPDSSSGLLCRAGASWSFFANPAYRSQAQSLCAFTNPKESSLCAQKADLLIAYE